MVSAIITTYKRKPEMVLRALDSILAQTYKDIEIIVVDDSPADYPLREDVKNAIIGRKKGNQDIEIRYIAHEKNMGGCVARNTGMEAAKGEYLAYLDDDDEWLPEKIEKQMEVMLTTDVALVCCGSKTIDEKDNTISIRDDTLYRGNVLMQLLHRNFVGSTSFPLIKKSCLVSVGGFDPLMQAVQDYDVWLRLAEKYAIDFVDEPLVLYHIHMDERITTNAKRRINGTERLCQKFNSYLEADRKLWWDRHTELSRQYAYNGEKKKAISMWCKCVCKYPENLKGNVIYLYNILKAMMGK